MTTCALCVWVYPGIDGRFFVFGLIEECPHEIREPLVQLREFVLDIEPHVDRHLVVPAPARVELLAQVPHLLDQSGLYVHMDVFQGIAERKPSLRNLRPGFQ